MRPNINHIFIDTNILYDDPFLKKQNKYLLDLANDNNSKIYISELVIQEIYQILKARLKVAINEYKRSKSIIQKLSQIDFSDQNLERSKILEDLLTFYNKLFESGQIFRLKLNHSVLGKTIEDLVEKKAPFFINGKNELKDCIIWYTYAEYAKFNKLNHCLLITNNYKDFGNQNKIINDNLVSQHHFELINSIEDLRNKILGQPSFTASELSLKKITEERITSILFKNQIDVLIDRLNFEVEGNTNWEKLFNNSLAKGLIQISDIILNEIEINNDSNTNNYQQFYGFIKATLIIDLYDTRSKRIQNGSRISKIDEIESEVFFNYDLVLSENDFIEYLDISNLKRILQEDELPWLPMWEENDDLLPF